MFALLTLGSGRRSFDDHGGVQVQVRQGEADAAPVVLPRER